MTWCLPGLSLGCHLHRSGCPAPWGCRSLCSRNHWRGLPCPLPWDPSAMSQGCWHLSQWLALASLQLAELGSGSEPCLHMLLGRRRERRAGTLGDTGGMALLPTFPEALQQPQRAVGWQNHASPVQAHLSSACSDSRGLCKCPGGAGCWDIRPRPDSFPRNKETSLQT